MIRFRLYYAKTEPLRYTSNLDMQKIWERTLRRAGLPIVYSQGFHPQPRLHQAAPLPLGITSDAEIIDAWLADDITISEIETALQNSLPPGIEIHKLEIVPLNSPNLQVCIESSDYIALLPNTTTPDELLSQVEVLLSATTLLRQRREKTYDLRPLILELKIHPVGGHPVLHMRLSARESATGRPDEVLHALGVDPLACKIHRVALHFL
jgi:radical SAM-linked protein